MKSLTLEQFQLGVCYYPEHWSEDLWEDDYRRMVAMGFSVVRMAEFAWSLFEPEEGTFAFELFDKALDLAYQHGLKVILGTPTATPPAWLTHKYPEVLNVSQNGIAYHHGQRRHYNYNAPIYRELSLRIVTEMVNQYKDHPAVVGWQIDNELNCEVNVFYSESDHAAFRHWLRQKYGSLAHLNRAWGTVFWSQTYIDWAQVHLTRPTPSDSPNPHQALDEKRFFSDSAIAYASLQADIIRKLAPHHWITTNGLFGHLNSHKLTQDHLDFMSYDSYPNFGVQVRDESPVRFEDRRWSWNLSIIRSVSPNFCVMEQQSGPGGWVNRIEQSSPKPGQLRLWTYQSIAHGADMLLYFRWRTATMGTEIYWHGINDYHNRPNRRVREAEQVGMELSGVGRRLVGTRFQAEVAIVKDYDNEWDGELDKWHGPYARDSEKAWFRQLQEQHIPVDALFLDDDTTVAHLVRYKTLVYPHPTIMTERVAQMLVDYVHQGGQIVFGCRSGYKTETGQCRMDPLPGPIADLCGITVDEFSILLEHEPALSIMWDAGNGDAGSDLPGTGTTAADGRAGAHAPTRFEHTATGFMDVLHVEADGVEVLARYSSQHVSGKPAAVRRSTNRGLTGTGSGGGAAYYYGSVFDVAAVDTFIRLLGLQSPVSEWAAIPADVEVAIRQTQDCRRSFVFLLNFSGLTQTCEFRENVVDVLTGTSIVAGQAQLEPYGVWIIER